MIVNGEAKALHAGLKEVVRTSVIVMYSIGWRDSQFMRSAFASINVTDDPNFAYGYGETAIKQFSAAEISRAEAVDDWLMWLSLQPGEWGAQGSGRTQVARIQDWARGRPLWQIAQGERCSERTIMNRIDRSHAILLDRLFNVKVDVQAIFEDLEKQPLSFFDEKAVSGYAGTRDKFGKVFVHGSGFMRNGKPLRDGRHKAEDKKLHRERAR